jgi:hypothetical protein
MASLLETLRYERKYFTLDYSAEDLEQFVLANPAVFRSQYYPRRVCSIYFDTPNLDYYALNVIGSADRKKFGCAGMNMMTNCRTCSWK